MLTLQDDLSTVFFGSDFASQFRRVRPLVDDIVVSGIFGVVDRSALDGHAVAASRVLLLPASADLRADDELVAIDPLPQEQVAVGARFRVLDVPKHTVDGLEMEALLGSVAD